MELSIRIGEWDIGLTENNVKNLSCIGVCVYDNYGEIDTDRISKQFVSAVHEMRANASDGNSLKCAYMTTLFLSRALIGNLYGDELAQFLWKQ